MALSITSNYAGEVAEGIITNLVTGNQTISGGHVYVTSVKKTLNIPKLASTVAVQDYAAIPTSTGALTFTEAQLGVNKFNIYTEFNPFDFDDFWRPAAADSPLVFKELPSEMQVELVSEILRGNKNWWETNIWQGSTGGTAPNDKFNGFITNALADATVVDIASPVALTSGNIVSKLDLVRAAASEALWMHPDCKVFMGYAAGQLYTQAQQAQANKGIDFTSGGLNRYWGKEVVTLAGIPADTIFLAVGNANRSSNLWLGVEAIGDNDLVQVEKLQANADLYFIKMTMKGGSVIPKGAETVLYNV